MQEILAFFMEQYLLPWRSSNLVHFRINLARPHTSSASLVMDGALFVQSSHKGARGGDRRFYFLYFTNVYGNLLCALRSASCREWQDDIWSFWSLVGKKQRPRERHNHPKVSTATAEARLRPWPTPPLSLFLEGMMESCMLTRRRGLNCTRFAISL